MAVTSSSKDADKIPMDNGKYVRYTPEQVEALERVYYECPKPSSIRRQQLVRDCPILCNIEPKQIKVWFQNRRCREKQRKESSRLQAVNRKLTSMNRLLMEENDRLQKQVSQLVYDNNSFRQQTQNANLGANEASSDSVVTSGQRHQISQHPLKDASPAGLLSVAEETLTEFISKATGTAVEWVQLPGMKPGPDSIGIVAISPSSAGVAARACGLVGLEPTKVLEIIKDQPSWFRDCRAVDVLHVLPTGNGGTIELLYMQLYSPTTLAPARDFWLLRYTSVLEDGSLVVCERSLHNTQNGPSMPPVQNFVRAEMLPSGCLIRPCEGGGSVIHIVDHMDLEPWSVPEVLRPLYQSSTLLAQKTTMAAFRLLRQISQENSQPNVCGWGRKPAVLRKLSQKLSRGFNEAINGFSDDGWAMLESDGVDDVTLLVNSSPTKFIGGALSCTNGFPSSSCAVLCAKASVLFQDVPPAVLLRFFRENRSEWADSSIDAYSAASIKMSPCVAFPSSTQVGAYGGQVILPLANTIEQEEFVEAIKIENIGHYQDGILVPGDIYFIQVCTGMDENSIGTCAELIFSPIDASFPDDAPILSSGFRIISLDSAMDASSPSQTLDLTSALDVGKEGTKGLRNSGGRYRKSKSVMTIAFQFAFEVQLEENVAAMARQYVRSIMASVQRVAFALAPSHFGTFSPLHSPPQTPQALTLAQWICHSYRCFVGVDLLKNEERESLLRTLWHHSDAVMCCSLKAVPAFTFANQAGLDMLETTLIALNGITLEMMLDDDGKKTFFSEFPHILQQGFVYLQGGCCLSSMGRPVSYDRAVAWKVLNEEENVHCICFMFINWSFDEN